MTRAAGEYERDGELLALGQMMDGYRKRATAQKRSDDAGNAAR